MNMENFFKKNENDAEIKIREGKFTEAEELLLSNVKNQSSSDKTYQLLIKIYKATGDYKSLIKVVNIAIKNCKKNRKEFKELKKVIVLNKLLKDIFKY